MFARTAAVLALLASNASAQPAVAIAVTGDCPSSEQVRASLSSLVPISSGEGPWTVEVTPRSTGATLSLRDPANEVVTTRDIASSDCKALADAFAVIVQAQFVDLRLLPAAVVGPIAVPTASMIPPVPSAPDAVAAAPVVLPPRVSRSSRHAWDAGLAGGIDVSGSDATRSGFGQLDLGASRKRWHVRQMLGFDAPITIASMTDRVELTRLTARLDAGYRVPLARGWLQPMLGVGVAAWRADALDLPDTSPTWRFEPIGTAALVFGIPLAHRVALRLESAATVFLVRHRYLVDPEGVVARSPRGAIATSAGVQWRFR